MFSLSHIYWDSTLKRHSKHKTNNVFEGCFIVCLFVFLSHDVSPVHYFLFPPFILQVIHLYIKVSIFVLCGISLVSSVCLCVLMSLVFFFFLTWLFVFLFICFFLFRFIFVLYYFIRHSF